MTIVGVVCAYGEPETLGDAVRSLVPWVDGLLLYSVRFVDRVLVRKDSSPEVFLAAAGRVPAYVHVGDPAVEVEEHEARTAALALAASRGAISVVVLDADELLLAETTLVSDTWLGAVLGKIRRGQALAVRLPVRTVSLLHRGGADTVSEDQFAAEPLVGARGYQARVVPAGSTYHATGRGAPLVSVPQGTTTVTDPGEGAEILNLRHMKSYASYRSAHGWESRLRRPAQESRSRCGTMPADMVRRARGR